MPSPKRTPARKASGPNIPEAQRGTVRVRLPRDAHARAEQLAKTWGCTVAEAITAAVERVDTAGGVN